MLAVMPLRSCINTNSAAVNTTIFVFCPTYHSYPQVFSSGIYVLAKELTHFTMGDYATCVAGG